MVFVFVIVALLLFFPDAYILMGVMGKYSWWLKGLFLLPTVACYAVMVLVFIYGDIRQKMLNWLLWLLLVVVVPVVLFTLISLFGKGVALLKPSAGHVFNIAGLVVAAIWLVMALYGIAVGWKKVKVENIEIRSPRIPEAFDGYKIVQLTDFHIGTYELAPSAVGRIVDKVNALNPDLIVFTGDLVNASASELNMFKDVLKRLRAKDGIYSVLGNHDYCQYRQYHAPDTPEKELQRLIAGQNEIGWQLLRNEAVQINRGGERIAVIGVDNAGGKNFVDTSDLPKAMEGLDGGEFKILLSHDPSHWRREVLESTDIDLTLAGHTHAMQFRIGSWSPSKWTYPEWGGLYRRGDRVLYVSTGIGENIAFRFGAWPEIALLTLKHGS